MSNSVSGNSPKDDLFMLLERAKGATDEASQRSNAFRDMAEMALNGPLKILGGIGDILKSVLGGISG